MIFSPVLRKLRSVVFAAVEFIVPYDYDIEELKQVLASNKLEHTLHNLPAGDWRRASGYCLYSWP